MTGEELKNALLNNSIVYYQERKYKLTAIIYRKSDKSIEVTVELTDITAKSSIVICNPKNISIAS